MIGIIRFIYGKVEKTEKEKKRHVLFCVVWNFLGTRAVGWQIQQAQPKEAGKRQRDREGVN